MESKINLKVSSLMSVKEISQVLATSLYGEYLVDTMRALIRKYENDIDLKSFVNKFANILNKSYSVSFASVNSWQLDKNDIHNQLIDLAKEIDTYLFSNQIIGDGDFKFKVQSLLTDYIGKISTIKITKDFLDLEGSNVSKEHLKNSLQQLRLLNESIVLQNLASMELEFTPLDTQKDRNKFVEEKLKRLNKLVVNCKQIFDDDYDKLLNQILAMYDKFYDIMDSLDTDAEKVEKSRKILKTLSPHKVVLDKLENKLAEANELKRQLIVHNKKISANLQSNIDLNTKKEMLTSDEQEVLKNQLDANIFVANKYSQEISDAIDGLTSLQEKMTNHYKVLDQLEISLKGAIPTEEDMKKYSAIVYKFQELAVRLELDKSQPNKLASEVIKIMNTAITGLKGLSKSAIEFKDLYLRNSMLTAIFRAINDLNDFATSSNKAEQLKQIKFIAEKLDDYTNLSKIFGFKLLDFRKFANELVRNVSIIISKQITAQNMYELLDILDSGLKQLDTLFVSLDDNHKNQIVIMKQIMDI